MKRFFALLTAMAMVLALVSCGTDKTDTTAATSEEVTSEEDNGDIEAVDDGEEEVMILGGYTVPEDMSVTDDMQEIFDKAFAGMTGAGYEPIICLGTQVVAGTNYRFLCRKTLTTEDGEETLAIVTIYADLQGNAEVTEILDSEADAAVCGNGALAGGWTAPEEYAVYDSAEEALEKALEDMTGADYKAVALLGTQVVAGTNYSYLCEVTPVTPDAESHYAVVIVYRDLDDNCEITQTADFISDAAEE